MSTTPRPRFSPNNDRGGVGRAKTGLVPSGDAVLGYTQPLRALAGAAGSSPGPRVPQSSGRGAARTAAQLSSAQLGSAQLGSVRPSPLGRRAHGQGRASRGRVRRCRYLLGAGGVRLCPLRVLLRWRGRRRLPGPAVGGGRLERLFPASRGGTHPLLPPRLRRLGLRIGLPGGVAVLHRGGLLEADPAQQAAHRPGGRGGRGLRAAAGCLRLRHGGAGRRRPGLLPARPQPTDTRGAELEAPGFPQEKRAQPWRRAPGSARPPAPRGRAGRLRARPPPPGTGQARVGVPPPSWCAPRVLHCPEATAVSPEGFSDKRVGAGVHGEERGWRLPQSSGVGRRGFCDTCSEQAPAVHWTWELLIPRGVQVLERTGMEEVILRQPASFGCF